MHRSLLRSSFVACVLIGASIGVAPQAGAARGELDPQTVSFTTVPPNPAIVGGTYLVDGTASSNLPVVISLAVGSTGCSLVQGAGQSATATFTQVGTCVINLNQPGNGSTLPAPQVQQSITVGAADPDPIAQAITFVPPVAGTVGGSDGLSASGGASGNPVTFSVDGSSGEGVCHLEGSTVVYDAAGSCVLNANQAGNADYEAAPQVQRTITVSAADPDPIAQAITFVPPVGGTVGGSDGLSASGGASGNPVTFSVDGSSGEGVCHLEGSTVVYDAAGSCVLNANQAGNADYEAAPQVQRTITVSAADPDPIAQAITFVPPVGGTVGGSDGLSASGGASGNPVTFSVDGSSGEGVCHLEGSTVVYDAAGSCVLNANQAGNADYEAAPQVQRTITVSAADPDPIAQAITFVPPVGGTVGGSDGLSASGGASGNLVTFSVDGSSGEGVCHLEGSTVVYDAAGSCVLNANQAGNADYEAAPQVQRTITVSAADPDPIAQAITFAAADAGTVGGGETLSATGGGSGNPVTFLIDEASAAFCALTSATVVSYTGAGSCVIHADQAGDEAYSAAPRVTETTVVSAADPDSLAQAITFAAADAGTVGGGETLSATGGGSGNPVTFLIDEASAAFCALTSATVVSYTGAGSCVIHADQAGDEAYSAAPRVTETTLISAADPDPIAQTIRFTDPGTGVVGQTVGLIAVGGASGSPVFFSLDPSTGSGVCSLSGATVTYLAAGSCVINADQAGAPGFYPAPRVTRTVVVTVPQGEGGGASAGLPPRITVTVTSALPLRNGWYRTPVTATFQCFPGTAPLSGACPGPVTLLRDGRGQTVTRSITDTAGLTASVTSAPIAIDRQAPAVRPVGITADHVYLAGPLRTLQCAATDALSGVATCTVSQARRGNQVLVTARATDRAGNSRATVTRYYQATYLISGARFVNSAYQLQAGRRYTVLIYDPSGRHHGLLAPAPRGMPPGIPTATRFTGVPNLWSKQLTVTSEMAENRHWTLTRPSWEISPRLYFDIV